MNILARLRVARCGSLADLNSKPKQLLLHLGNKKSLDEIPKSKSVNVRDELLAFHDKYYSANLMSLTVVSKGKQKRKKSGDCLCIYLGKRRQCLMPQSTHEVPNGLERLCFSTIISCKWLDECVINTIFISYQVWFYLLVFFHIAEPLDEMTRYVCELFGGIENKQVCNSRRFRQANVALTRWVKEGSIFNLIRFTRALAK